MSDDVRDSASNWIIDCKFPVPWIQMKIEFAVNGWKKANSPVRADSLKANILTNVAFRMYI